MTLFNKEKAIARYTELSRFIQTGAYDNRESVDSHRPISIEEEIDALKLQAAYQGLAFHWHQRNQTYTLGPMTAEDFAAFQQAIDTFTASLPSGIKQDIITGYESQGNLQPEMAIRHWLEIPNTHVGSKSHWTCDGYASSHHSASMIAGALHKSFRHAYEVWSLKPFGNSKGPYILDFVPRLDTDPAKYHGDWHDVSELKIKDFAERWVIRYYGIHESNYQYVKSLQVTFPTRNRVYLYKCLVQFSQSGERVELQMQNVPGGLIVFSLRYDQTRSEG